MLTAFVDGREVVDGEVLVRYRPSAGSMQRQRAEVEVDSSEVEMLDRRGNRLVRSRRMGTRAMLLALRNNPDVEFAEPNFVIRVKAVPNEGVFPGLWGLLNTGQMVLGVTGVPGADIHATEAWDSTTGSRSSVVGIIDTGIDYHHVDLAANVWTAPRAFSVTIGGVSITCAAGTHGFNAINNTCDPMDDHSHGTHVAGTIGAVGNNGIGVAGVNWVASMMGLKFLDASGFGATSDAIKAIEFAIQARFALGIDANVRILSNSWGGYGFSAALANEIQAASGADMLFVAAAGNDTLNDDSTPFYPASYASSNVISVAATTSADGLAPFSNYGAASVHVGAPGTQILSTVPNNVYAFMDGTSMATPHVSGAAALVLSQCSATTATLKDSLLSTVDPVLALAGRTITGGRINVQAALQRCRFGAPTISATLTGSTITAVVANTNGAARVWAGLFCPASNNDATYGAWQYLNGTQTPPAQGLTSATLTFTAPSQGGVSCNLRLFNQYSVRQATSETFVTSVRTPTMTVSTPVVAPGGVISVTLGDGPAGATDWLTLNDQFAADSQYRDWMYLNGLRTPPASGLTSATVQFIAPTTPGVYNIRWFANNSTATRLAISSDITVLAQPTLTINDLSVTEGNSGTTTAAFTVTLSPPNASQTVTVGYATANGTATTAGDDYIATSGTLTFAPSVSTRTISVIVRGDAVIEPNETFFVNLSGATNAVIGDAQGVGTIVTDDASVGAVVNVTTPSVAPGGTIAFTVTGGPANPTDWVALVKTTADDGAYVRWSYLNGSQAAPANGLSNASLQFTAPLVADTYDIRVFANNQLNRIGRSGAITVGTQSTITIADTSIVEGNSGTSTAQFTVTLSPINASQTVTVNYATADGTATVADGDYVATSGTLTFTPTTATQTISVPVYGDLAIEGDETFFVNLSGATNAGIGDTQGRGTISTDDMPAGPSVGALTVADHVSVSVANGPANPGDWLAIVPRDAPDSAYGVWMYLNGSTTPPPSGLRNVSLDLPGPTIPGTYDVRLFANNQLTRIARSDAFTVATDPVLTIGDAVVIEGNSGTSTMMFTVSLSPVNASQTVTVSYSTGDLTATVADNDYVATSGTLTFTPSTATQTISVPVNGDTKVEPNEAFVVNLSLATNAGISDAQAVGSITNDDGGAIGPAINLALTTVQPGALIEFAVSGGPANALDWVTLTSASAADGAYLDWTYLNGTRSAPAAGRTSASLRFTAPSTPGQYNIRFFADNRLTQKLATSVTFTVAP